MAELTETLDLLRRVDTPTVCNAIEVIEGKRGFDAFTRGHVLASDPGGVIFGQARTAKISAVAPATELPETVLTRRMAYYRHMSEGQGARLAVVEDVDAVPVGAYWGELNTTVHKGFGLCGALTNGVMRDLGDLAPDFPVLAGHIGPSHAFVHVTAVACSVQVFGLRIAPDDWVHADRHGALVIPAPYLAELPAAIAKMQRTERIVLDAARAPDFDFARFEAAWTAFEKART